MYSCGSSELCILMESCCYSVVAKTRGFLPPIENCHLNRKLTPNPILPNLSLQEKHNYTILLPNPPFFFYFSQTQHCWFSSYLTHASSSSPGFFLFFFSSPSPLTHASSPGLFFFFFFFFSLTPHTSSPSPLTHASSHGFFLLLLPHLPGDS
jgi:hypothetical protein